MSGLWLPMHVAAELMIAIIRNIQHLFEIVKRNIKNLFECPDLPPLGHFPPTTILYRRTKGKKVPFVCVFLRLVLIFWGDGGIMLWLIEKSTDLRCHSHEK